MLRIYRMSLELFVWAIVGGLFVTILSAVTSYYQKQTPSNKQLSRDFLIGAIFTGFVYPIIPESFNEIKSSIQSTADKIQISGSSGIDPGVKVGPANF
jgi:O-antigen/teichoic acid export membrane protein